MPKLDDQISTLQERLQLLKLRQQNLEARKRAGQALRERKAATRRKILVGGVVLTKVQLGEIDPQQLLGWLNQALTRADDRALFDLPPAAAATVSSESAQ
jgi:Conjugal transfer protein TraD